MKNPFLMVTGVLALLAGGPAQAVMIFEASLDGAQEVPPNSSTAFGSAVLSLNDSQDRLEIQLQLTGLDLDGTQTPGDTSDDVVGAHIHRAPAGANGGVVFGFVSPNSDLNGDLVIDAIAGTLFSAWDLNEGNGTTLAAELPNLFNEGLYFNIHTPSVPSGEIRGQIARAPEPATASLLGLSLAGLAATRRGARRGRRLPRA
jgi:hypothetical protein